MTLFAVSSLDVLVLGVAFSVAVGGLGNFEPQCQSQENYGWPRFENLAELRASPWASYIEDVYGELPQEFPVCIYDLWLIDSAAYQKANITGRVIVDDASTVKEGDLFRGTDARSYHIYHGTWEPLPNNTWVEVTHTVFPTELEGFWVFRTRGSGIWYNTGRTMVFPTPSDLSKIHADAIAFLTKDCSIKPSIRWPLMESDIFGFCAREKGIDSIQFEPQARQKPLGTFGLTGMTEMVLVNIDGKYNCGVEDAGKTPLREGWMASRQCSCVSYNITDSCGLMPNAPGSIIDKLLASPLCKLQEGPFWNRVLRKCDPSTCKPTKCGIRSTSATHPVQLGHKRIASHAPVVV